MTVFFQLYRLKVYTTFFLTAMSYDQVSWDRQSPKGIFNFAFVTHVLIKR